MILHSIQARLVDSIKRHAISSTRNSPRGAAFFLRVYLEAEEQAEQPLLDELLSTIELPDWLRRQLERHQRDETRHAELLRKRLTELGQPSSRISGRFDALAKWKVSQLRRLIDDSAPRFEAGLLVGVLAVAWRMEAMGHRVLSRHRDALEPGDPTYAMIARIALEERGHAKGCKRALDKLVRPSESKALEQLVAEIDRVDRAFGVTGAFAMWMGAVGSASAARLPAIRRGRLTS